MRRDNRPLLKTGDPEDVMRDLMAARYPVYAEADLTVESRDVPHESHRRRDHGRPRRVSRLWQRRSPGIATRRAGGAVIIGGDAPAAHRVRQFSRVNRVHIADRPPVFPSRSAPAATRC